eukprot:CAMPEP_0206008466 /NCGR_PEP_ID=MMETSP1464-20131121/7599_1 /ASSEMBLY_ACC=CAM_ASM_001124 /TAXON_ID=119497 /ORGANISM="Exanthemachrysis gayraliae, Strain RCC1523" /LENGTH=210 /DNA_ID=CAMNT_0053382007 /DNA_START=55 /DNA_END=684 /DNA_ORIENTATION=-
MRVEGRLARVEHRGQGLCRGAAGLEEAHTLLEGILLPSGQASESLALHVKTPLKLIRAQVVLTPCGVHVRRPCDASSQRRAWDEALVGWRGRSRRRDSLDGTARAHAVQAIDSFARVVALALYPFEEVVAEGLAHGRVTGHLAQPVKRVDNAREGHLSQVRGAGGRCERVELEEIIGGKRAQGRRLRREEAADEVLELGHALRHRRAPTR